MKFRIFSNHIDEQNFTHRAEPDNPAVIVKPDGFERPSLAWEPLDESAHKCLVSYAEKKWAERYEAADERNRERLGEKAKAKYLAEVVSPIPKADEKPTAAAAAPADAPLTLKEFAQGGKKQR